MLDAAKHGMPRGAVLLLLVALTAAAPAVPACAPATHATYIGAEIHVSDYEYLSDYGEWVRVSRYGMVWRPYVVVGWSPFYHGHWSWTNRGWAWISYEPYGWLVYHYGYWDYRPRIGWFWVPGNVWSPARVQWHTFGGYCAWAPLPPPHVRWPDPWDRWDVNVWIVVDMRHFADDNVGRHRIAKPVQRETIRRETVTKRAPTLRRVETVTKRTIPAVEIERRPMNVRPETARRQPEPGRPRSAPLERMVLPERERQKVKEHAPKVEREVLAPRKAEPEKKQKAPEREKERKETETKKKTRTR